MKKYAIMDCIKAANSFSKGNMVDKYVEYGDLIVFSMKSKKDEFLDLIAVNRNTGKPFTFNPLLNDPDSYFKISGRMKKIGEI